MNAWADGLNYYLHTHPEVKPRVITRFEPWMALTFSEGSIGGDIERVNLDAARGVLRQGRPGRRSGAASSRTQPTAEPTGSNGIAIAPSNTAGRALLLINPHTSFFFRAEAQMVSDEGLTPTARSTWGQFFIYQGFNERAGWMHTSSGVDNIDEYLETVVEEGRRLLLPVRRRRAAGDGDDDRRAVQDGHRHGAEGVHRLPHASRTDRPRGGRQVGQRQADAGAAEGADAVLLAHQGEELQGVPRDDGAAHQLVEQHDLRRRRRQHRLLPLQLHSEARHQVRLDQAGGRQRSRRPSGTACTPIDETPGLLNPPAAGSTTPTTGRGRRPGRTARRRRTIPPTSSAAARTRAASTRSGCWRTRRTSRSTRSSRRRTTATCRRSRR